MGQGYTTPTEETKEGAQSRNGKEEEEEARAEKRQENQKGHDKDVENGTIMEHLPFMPSADELKRVQLQPVPLDEEKERRAHWSGWQREAIEKQKQSLRRVVVVQAHQPVYSGPSMFDSVLTAGRTALKTTVTPATVDHAVRCWRDLIDQLVARRDRWSTQEGVMNVYMSDCMCFYKTDFSIHSAAVPGIHSVTMNDAERKRVAQQVIHAPVLPHEGRRLRVLQNQLMFL